MILLLFLLSYYQSKRVKSKLPVLIFPSFGMKSGGSFMVSIQECASENLFIGLSVDDQVKRLWDSKFNYSKVCQPNSFNFTVFNTTIKYDPANGINLNHVVKESNTLSPVFIMCDTNYTTINATIIFKNPKNYLDSRYKLIYFNCIFHGLLYFATLLFLIFSIISKAVVFIKYHIYLIMTLLALFVEKCTEVIYYLHKARQPELTFFYYIHYSMVILSTGLLFSSVTLAAGGWQIHTVRFGLGSFLFSLFSGFCSGGTGIFPVLVLLLEPDIISYLIQLFSFITFAKVSIVELRTCEQYLQSYLLIIDTVGIDSKTTPVHRRYIMQNILLGILFTYSLAEVFILHIPLYFYYWHFWIIYTIRNGLNNLLMMGLVINYLPWRIDKESWFATFDDEDKLADCAMEDFNPEAYIPVDVPEKWEAGDKLPLPPLIAAIEYRIQSLDINDKEMPLIDKSI